MVTATGETTVVGNIGQETAVCGVVKNLGFDLLLNDLNSDSLNHQDCEVHRGPY